MSYLLALFIYLFTLVGGFATFLVTELYALSKKDDDFDTLSTYIKAARRKTGIAGSIVLTLAIFGPAFWLWGHLVMEWW